MSKMNEKQNEKKQNEKIQNDKTQIGGSKAKEALTQKKSIENMIWNIHR